MLALLTYDRGSIRLSAIHAPTRYDLKRRSHRSATCVIDELTVPNIDYFSHST